jgi:hypothetical protein
MEDLHNGVPDDVTLFVRLFEALPEPVLCVGTGVPTEPVVVYANTAIAWLLLGDRRADATTSLIGCPLAALPGALVHQVLVPLCRDVLAHEEARTRTEVSVPDNGAAGLVTRPEQPGYVEVHAQPVRDPASGRITAVLFVLRDVTERVLLREVTFPAFGGSSALLVKPACYCVALRG